MADARGGAGRVAGAAALPALEEDRSREIRSGSLKLLAQLWLRFPGACTSDHKPDWLNISIGGRALIAWNVASRNAKLLSLMQIVHAAFYACRLL
jgi:hypothetical protein